MWLILLRTLRGQYEAMTGEHDVVFCKQQHFIEIWTKAKVFSSFGQRIKWRYAPLRRPLSAPPSWKDPDFRCVNTISKVIA